MFLEKKITLVIPAKNEAQNISRVLTEIPDFIDEIIIVTSSVQDTTLNELMNLKEKNRIISMVQDSTGKGDAQRKGLSKATGDYICMIDADGSVNLNELNAMLNLIISGDLDLVKGSRYLKTGGSEDLTKFRSFGNLALTKIANFLFSKQWSDLAYGFVAYKRDSIIKLKLFSVSNSKFWRGYDYGNGFELETIILTRMARHGLLIEEFPSFELKRVDGFSNLRAIRDGFRILFSIIYERFSSRH
jgi:glycosyltransferase involved in cell wall biosynthesis